MNQEGIHGTGSSGGRILHYQPIFVPSLLQTPEYARSVVRITHDADTRNADGEVVARLSRQRVLFDPGGPDYHFVLTEAALRWRPGPWSVLRAQLHRLRSLGDLPRVTIQVMPWLAEATAVGLHGFVAQVPPGGEEATEVTLEIVSGLLPMEDPDIRAYYKETFDRLAATALRPAESSAYILELAQSMPGDSPLG